jgi:hypothetical protein
MGTARRAAKIRCHIQKQTSQQNRQIQYLKITYGGAYGSLLDYCQLLKITRKPEIAIVEDVPG